MRQKIFKNPTVYQIIAKKYGVSEKYVGMIARGERIPKRGIGLKIEEEIKEIINNNN